MTVLTVSVARCGVSTIMVCSPRSVCGTVIFTLKLPTLLEDTATFTLSPSKVRTPLSLAGKPVPVIVTVSPERAEVG